MFNLYGVTGWMWFCSSGSLLPTLISTVTDGNTLVLLMYCTNADKYTVTDGNTLVLLMYCTNADQYTVTDGNTLVLLMHSVHLFYLIY